MHGLKVGACRPMDDGRCVLHSLEYSTDIISIISSERPTPTIIVEPVRIERRRQERRDSGGPP